ncbi:MAG: fumarylacetoacetate hydrolase family protein, partial [bacterium]|nr:fumarylacetoacetate hydrolase family protein [bacterium]
MTLYPGSIILTGTPPGVGEGRDPKVFLRKGDSLTVSISGIGKLTNPVALEK